MVERNRHGHIVEWFPLKDFGFIKDHETGFRWYLTIEGLIDRYSYEKLDIGSEVVFDGCHTISQFTGNPLHLAVNCKVINKRRYK